MQFIQTEIIFLFLFFIIPINYTTAQQNRNNNLNSSQTKTIFYPPSLTEENSESSLEPNKDSVVLKGNVPVFEYPQLYTQSESIWFFIKNILKLPKETAPPVIYFFPFNKKIQDQELTDLQEKWILKNPFIWTEYIYYNKNNSSEKIKEFFTKKLPFPKSFIAFHYDNTNYIQINPQRAFLPYYQNDPYGVKKDLLGLGFYIMGHEMLHYAFQEKEILPSRNHHCLFTLPLLPNEQNVLEALSDFLIAHKYSSSLIKILGPKKEKRLMPCQNIENTTDLLETAKLKLQ